ncbi:hypothetical protein AA313_de0202247 [Arthrobotrys entomopaga]|nr:hypothetical protein AA313_de0202247 [Arthrobotrys entomopaga]
MADPISLSSGILTLAIFALQSSQLLYKTISSFKSNKRTVRELGEELVALQGVLESLRDTINGSDADLKALTLPLHRCGKACLEFEALIAKLSSDSSGVRAIKDWAKVQYMGDDITGFKVSLSGYKSTIMIAICDVNMRTTNITAKLLSEYKTLIEQTTSDLEEQLEGINGKLDNLTLISKPDLSNVGGGMVVGQVAEEDKRGIEEDKKSIEQCLRICFQVSEHIDKVQLSSVLSSPADSSDKARKLTTDALTGCKVELFNTTNALQKQLEDIQIRLAALSNRPESVGNNSGAEEIESLKQCLAICFQASEQVRNNRMLVFEDVKMEDDGEQIIVATMGDLLSAKRVTSGSRSVQWLGQMSDASLQYLAGRRSPPMQYQQKFDGKDGGIDTQNFEGRHGAGHMLRK